ncbi:hypothetical protein [Neotabrizicola shimadae]|uniref:Uncharacterized protein n=1 Tax=Neotabrizicola shimadae TaxID=2807096 RepID=A0A8G0ZT37_9RHOB|nr:hypothetical protein [Neotabrizicola shimadae]QYZ69542.1 hypothetical protein JO391_17755 [Neotabrizicola shimadae]
MSDALPLPATTEPLRVAIRRLRWFRDAFARQLNELTAETGVAFTVDDRTLAQIFVAWLRDVEAQKPADPAHRRAYFDFVSALMLRNLLRDLPVKAGPLPPGADTHRAEYFWPEGFACTLFCLNVRAAVIEQEFDAATELTPDFFSLRQWWSFRENVGQDADTAMGFFDVFIGANPEWQMPASFRCRLEHALTAPHQAQKLG